jgi:hypothetical protein
MNKLRIEAAVRVPPDGFFFPDARGTPDFASRAAWQQKAGYYAIESDRRVVR